MRKTKTGSLVKASSCGNVLYIGCVFVSSEQWLRWRERRGRTACLQVRVDRTTLSPYIRRSARWWMVGECPPRQSSSRNLAASSGVMRASFFCTPSSTRIVDAFVSITTSSWKQMASVNNYFSQHISNDIRSIYISIQRTPRIWTGNSLWITQSVPCEICSQNTKLLGQMNITTQFRNDNGHR